MPINPNVTSAPSSMHTHKTSQRTDLQCPEPLDIKDNLTRRAIKPKTVNADTILLKHLLSNKRFPAQQGEIWEPKRHPDIPAAPFNHIWNSSPFVPKGGQLLEPIEGQDLVADTGSVFWPIRNPHKSRMVNYMNVQGKFVGDNSSRSFLYERPASKEEGHRCYQIPRWHCGVDLYADDSDTIVACEAGTITNSYCFYKNVWCLIVEHRELVINYGEIGEPSKGIKIGTPVKAGQEIGQTQQMDNDSMLHFETYRKGTKKNEPFCRNGKPPPNLLSPVEYLIELAKVGK